MEKFEVEDVLEELQLESMKPLMKLTSGRTNFKSKYFDMHDEELGPLLVALAFAALGALLQGVSGSKEKEDTESSNIIPQRTTLQRAIGQLRLFARSAQDLHDRLTELIEEKGKESTEWGEEKVRFMRRIVVAEEEVKELKKRRSEDAKANEKVVRIYANREQAWKLAKQKLRHEIDMLRKDHTGSPRATEFEMKTRRLADIEKKLKDREVMAKAVMEKAKADCLELTSSLSAEKVITAQLNEKLEAELANSAEREIVLDEVRAKLANSEKELESTKAHLEALSSATENHSAMTQKLLVEFATLRQESEDKDVMIATMLERASVEREVKEDLARELASKHSTGEESAQWNRLSANLHVEEVFNLRRQVEVLEKQVAMYRAMTQASSASTPIPALFSAEPLSAWLEVEKGRFASQLEEKHWNQVETFERHLRAKDERLAALRSKLITMESELAQSTKEVKGDPPAPLYVRPTEQTKTLLQNILRDVECVRCARMENPPLDLKDSNDKLTEKEAEHLATVEDVQENWTKQPVTLIASAYSGSARDTHNNILSTQAPSKGTRPARIDMEDEKPQRTLFTDMDAPITNPTFIAEEKNEKMIVVKDRKTSTTRDNIQVLGLALEVRRIEEQLCDMNSSLGNARTLLSRTVESTSVKPQGCIGLAGKVSRLARNIGLPRSFRKASAPKLENKKETSTPVVLQANLSMRKNPLFTQESDLASLQQRAEKVGENLSAIQARLTKESSPEFYEPLLFPECKFRTPQVQGGALNSKPTHTSTVVSTRRASPKHSAPPPMTILTSRTSSKPASKPVSSPTRPASKLVLSPTRPASKFVSSPTRPASKLVSSPTRPASKLVSSPTRPASKPMSSPTRPASKLVSSPTRPAPTKSKPAASSPTRPVLIDSKHTVSPVNFPSTKPPALRIIRSTKLLNPSPVTPTKPVPSLQRKEGSPPNRTQLLAHPKTSSRDFMKDDCKMRTAFGRTEPRTKTSSRNEIQPRQWARTTSTHFELDLEHLR